MSMQPRDRGTEHHRGLFHRKHTGKAIQALPMLFTFTPLQQGHQAHGVVGSFSQAGGHEGVFKANGPILEKQVGERERAFYTAAAAGEWPPAFLPACHGSSGGEGRIGLENLLHGLKCPCVMDLKMGTRSVEATEHSILKKVKMSALDLFTRTAFTGVRLEGMSVHRALEHGRVKTTKAQSHAISANATLNLEDVMMFFLTDESGVRRDVAKRFLRSLRHLLHHFETANDRFLFIGSSILLIYDNDNAAPHSRWARALERATRLPADTYAALRRKTRVDMRMIDFAHTGPLPRGQQRDHGYITGLKTVIAALEHVIRSGSCPQRPIFSVAAAAADAAAGAASALTSAAAALTPGARPADGRTSAEGRPSGHAEPSPQPAQTPLPGSTLKDQNSMHDSSWYPTIPPPPIPAPSGRASGDAGGAAHPADDPHQPRGLADEAALATGVWEPTFSSLLGVPPLADQVRGDGVWPAGEPRYPDVPALAEGEGRWQWPGMGAAGAEGGVLQPPPPVIGGAGLSAAGGVGGVAAARPTV